jgi:DNA processing protein
VKGIGEKTVAALRRRPGTESVQQELEKAWENGVSLITWDSDAYPQLLREIHNPPIVLYVKGRPEILSHPGIALVGSRAATSYGKKTAENLASNLAGYEITVISGMALGIDAAAHRGALSAGGTTVAVLGCGPNIIYPPQNRSLYEEIVERGAVVSEYPLDTQPENFRFPARNRIISGLSLGVVVVEAAQRSGSLITAEMALEQGREVFAVPGRIDSLKSAGCHRLLQEGAKLVRSVEDILSELPGQLPPARKAGDGGREEKARPPLNGDEKLIFSSLDVYPKNIEDIITTTGLPAHAVAGGLLHLELHGLIEVLPGRQYLNKN